MTANSSENCGGSSSPNASIQNSRFFSPAITSLSYDQNSIGSVEKRNCAVRESSNSQTASISLEVRRSSGSSPDTPTSKNESSARDNKECDFPSKEELGAKADKLLLATSTPTLSRDKKDHNSFIFLSRLPYLFVPRLLEKMFI